MSETIKSKPLRYVLYFLGGVALAVIFAFVFGYFVMLLWNWLMPEIFGLGTITFWQSAGIILLIRLVFGNFKHPSHHKPKHPDFGSHHHFAGGHFFKNKKIKEKFDEFTNSKQDWKHYHEFWEEEGKQSFKEYADKKKSGAEDIQE